MCCSLLVSSNKYIRLYIYLTLLWFHLTPVERKRLHQTLAHSRPSFTLTNITLKQEWNTNLLHLQPLLLIDRHFKTRHWTQRANLLEHEINIISNINLRDKKDKLFMEIIEKFSVLGIWQQMFLFYCQKKKYGFIIEIFSWHELYLSDW